MRQKTRMTAAQVIVEYLIHEKVPYVFGIFGHGNVQLGEALKEREDEITFIPVKNEQNAVHMATAYAKMTGRPLAVTTSIGPGATNMVTGAACAHVNRLPVLLLPGDAFADSIGPVLQQVEGNSDVESRANDTLKPVSVYWRRISRPEQLQKALPEAFERMLQPGNMGPAVLCLPMDVQAEAYDYDLETLLSPRDNEWQRIAPDQRAIRKAAKLITAAQRPLIIAGGGVMMSRAWESLIDLAEYAKIPVVQTQAGNGTMLFTHPFNLFSLGPTGSDCGNAVAAEADLIIGVGTRYTDFTTSSETLFRPDAKFININISHVDIGKERAVKLFGDANIALKSLLEELKTCCAPNRAAYLAAVKKLREKWISLTTRWQTLDGHPLPQSTVIGTVNDFCAEQESTVVCAAGSLPGDLLRLWRTKDSTRKEYHLEYGYSTMGYEIAGGIGVKLAAPLRNVYVMVGDGSFLMASQDIVTAVQEGIAITIVLFDNHGHRSIYGCQTGNDLEAFATEYRMRDSKTGALSGNYLSIDFIKIAEGYGALAMRAETKEQLWAALDKARKEKARPTVIYVPTDTQRFEGRFEYAPHHGNWWDVPRPAVSPRGTLQKAREEYLKNKERQVVR